MSDFAIRLKIEGTKSELEHVITMLESKGYCKSNFSDYPSDDAQFLTTNRVPILGRSSGAIVDYLKPSNSASNDTDVTVSACDIELVKALASMRIDGEFQPGEIVFWTLNDRSFNVQFGSIAIVTCSKPNEVKWLKEIRLSGPNKYHGTDIICQQDGGYPESYFRRATPDEIIDLYKNLNPNASKANIEAFKIIKEFPSSGSIGTVLQVNETMSVEEGLTYPEFFEPIYKKVITSKTISVGNPKKTIVISSDGKVVSDKYSISTTVERLEKWANTTLGSPIAELGGDDVFKYNTYIKSIWVGCETSGTELRREDVDIIYATYLELINS